MISTVADGLTRRRGGKIVDEEQQQRRQQPSGGQGRRREQRLGDTILPIPIAAVAMSGAILVLVSLFMVWYHLYHDDEDDE